MAQIYQQLPLNPVEGSRLVGSNADTICLLDEEAVSPFPFMLDLIVLTVIFGFGAAGNSSLYVGLPWPLLFGQFLGMIIKL